MNRELTPVLLSMYVNSITPFSLRVVKYVPHSINTTMRTVRATIRSPMLSWGTSSRMDR